MTKGVVLNWNTPSPEHYLEVAVHRLLSGLDIKNPSAYTVEEGLQMLQKLGGFDRALQHVIFCLSLPPETVKMGVGGFIRGGISFEYGQLMTWSLSEWRDFHLSHKDGPPPSSRLIARHLSKEVASVIFPGLETKKKK